ncbi:MAG: adenylyl-sulfate kinase [Candidatus Omnitrophica bacterium]|nr:adenylyl-sulfate kinase [Candidatus Omnitrophota bacterium]
MMRQQSKPKKQLKVKTAGTIWITGLSASGKSTMGKNLRDSLMAAGITPIDLLDGEEVRKRLDKQYGFSTGDRNVVTLKLAELAFQSNQNGKIAIVCVISHVKELRDQARKLIGRFMEVYLDCPAEICAKRDYKGHYRKAFEGLYENFIGVTEPYEKSNHPDLILDTANKSVEECSSLLLTRALDFLTHQGDDRC